MRFREYFLSTAAIVASMLACGVMVAHADDDDGHRVKHVLLLSIDGFHQHDLATCLHSGGCPNLAKLAGRGVTYTNARTTTPSDSFPGMLAQVTGGTPKTTGVYYDDSYDRTLFSPDGKFPAVASGCSGNPGTEVVLDESIDVFPNTKLFSGGIDPAFLPQQRHADGSCTKVFPHDFVKVNTIFGVAHHAGLQTAWSDKHPAYDILNGPFVGAPNIDDLYTPEINSNIFTATPPGPASANGVDLAGPAGKCDATNSTLAFNSIAPVQYVDCAPTQEAYDDVKVNAVINWINGRHAEGQPWTGKAPAIFGMNFQAISVGQKLVAGGYDTQLAPKPILAHAITHTDASIGKMVTALKAKDLLEDTLIIVSAKHGQSPINPTKLQMEAKATQAPDHTVVDPGSVISAPVDQTFSAFTNPNSGSQYAQGGHLQTDDVGIVWLQPNTPADVKQAVISLRNNAKAIHADTLPPGTIFDSNITSGEELSEIFGDPRVPGSIAAARAPDIFIQPDHGVVYSGSKKKIAEHGGGSLDDTHVALLVAGPSVSEGGKVDDLVHTTQIAPTILRVLGLPPRALDSVRQEGTRSLPDLFEGDDD
ncbi:MAG TPA: alkaline phosphatase family protein [Bradyrhizobium sp.]|uniref:alkaline phosphatase family protein n=1 Tax=Bradyrhizobium sp. TaxID=376 RepID=UPI002D7EEB17|nr:alkaline phosphatase family protein [Bradyrhizobium sp.]HET7886528.1 alkaline phosphatase family protein [Bradyrhizobium sp.]